MTEPDKVLVVGDWHGNRRWAVDVIWRARALLPSESPRILVHCGDFGFWPYKVREWAEGDRKPEALQYLLDIQSALELADAQIWVTPGNHEWHSELERWQAIAVTESKVQPPAPFHPDTPLGRLDRILVLPRGYRWRWRDRTWLSVGGAVSVDRLLPKPGRFPGESWWPQEEVTEEQELAIIAGGHADVMVAHDYPARVQHTFDHHLSPVFHPDDLWRAARHTERMQRIVDGVKPNWYLHGHLHRAYSRTYDWGWGKFEITGMNMDGSEGNFAVLDIRSMTWQ